MSNSTVPSSRFPKILTLAAAVLVCSLSIAPAAESKPNDRPGEPDSAQSNENESVRVSWQDFGDENALAEVKFPDLAVIVRNLEPQDTDIAFECVITADGFSQTVPCPGRRLAPFEEARINVNFPTPLLHLDRLQFSGKIQVDVRSTTGDDRRTASATLPPLYYHSQRGRIVVYRGKVMREQFAAGNYQNLPLPRIDAVGELRQILLRGEITGVEPVFDRISRAKTFAAAPDPHGAPENTRFCFFMPGEAFNDSSDRVWVSPFGNAVSRDYGEDYGRAGHPIPMSRAWVALAQASGPIFSGMLDPYGCTPYVPAQRNALTLMAFSPIYFDAAKNIRGFVSDLNLGNTWPASMPLFFFLFQAANAPITFVPADASEPTQTMYAAASQAIERASFGQTNVLYEWQLRLLGDNNGTSTGYAPEGHPRISVKNTTTVRSKFTLAHEFGHAVLIAKLNPQFAQTDLDYSAEPGQSEQHSLGSKEWQLAAAIEGFGHFTAAITWNEAVPDDGAIYVIGSDVNPLLNQPAIYMDQFDRIFETSPQWNDAQWPGQGVEDDWAQFFWNFHTDTPLIGGVPKPSLDIIHDIWMQAYSDGNWPKNEGFFEDFSSAAYTVLSATVPAPIAALPHAWFMSIAGQAGVDH